MTAKFVVPERSSQSSHTYADRTAPGTFVDFEEETRSRLCEKGCRPGILARTRLRPHCAARGHSPRPAKR
jgi:hypothetical protein